MKVKELVALLLTENQEFDVAFDYGGAMWGKKAYCQISGVVTDDVYSVDNPDGEAFGVVVIE